MLKNQCFSTVVLEKTLASPLNCKETNRTVVEQTVIQQPVEEIIAIGMGCDPLPPKDPGSELVITDRHIFLPNGEVLTYTGTTRMLGSAYSQYDQGCGTITYSGTTVHIGTVAVEHQEPGLF